MFGCGGQGIQESGVGMGWVVLALKIGAGLLAVLAVAGLVSLKDDYEAANNEGKYKDGN